MLPFQSVSTVLAANLDIINLLNNSVHKFAALGVRFFMDIFRWAHH